MRDPLKYAQLRNEIKKKLDGLFDVKTQERKIKEKKARAEKEKKRRYVSAVKQDEVKEEVKTSSQHPYLHIVPKQRAAEKTGVRQSRIYGRKYIMDKNVELLNNDWKESWKEDKRFAGLNPKQMSKNEIAIFTWLNFDKISKWVETIKRPVHQIDEILYYEATDIMEWMEMIGVKDILNMSTIMLHIQKRIEQNTLRKEPLNLIFSTHLGRKVVFGVDPKMNFMSFDECQRLAMQQSGKIGAVKTMEEYYELMGIAPPPIEEPDAEPIEEEHSEAEAAADVVGEAIESMTTQLSGKAEINSSIESFMNKIPVEKIREGSCDVDLDTRTISIKFKL